MYTTMRSRRVILIRLFRAFVAFLCVMTLVHRGKAQTRDSMANDREMDRTVLRNEANLSLHFEEVPLDEALRMLERTTGGRIVFNDRIVRQHRVSGTFSGRHLSEVLHEMLAGLPLRVHTVSENQLVIAPETDRGQNNRVDRRQVSGVVLDLETKEPLSGASIYVKGAMKGGITNHQGHFSLAWSPPSIGGSYPATPDTIVVRHIGYEAVYIPTDLLSPGLDLRVELGIQAVSLEAVEVTAERNENDVTSRKTSQYQLVPSELEWLPSSSDNAMLRALQLLPGISGGQDGRAQIAFRGGTPFQHLFRLNGITLYHTHHLFGFSSAINEEVIGRLDVYKGGFPARFGGRTSGVLHAVGRKGDFDRLQLSFGLNGLHAGGWLNVPLAGRGSVQLAFRRSFTEIFESPLYRNRLSGTLGRFENDEESIEVMLPPDRLKYGDFFAQVYYHPGARSTLSLTAYESNDELNYAYVDPALNISEDEEEPFFVNFEENNGAEAHTQGLAGSLQFHHSRSMTGTMEVAYTRFQNHFVYDTRFTNEEFDQQIVSGNDNTLTDFSLRLGHLVSFGVDDRLELGGWLSKTEVGYTYFENEDREFIMNRGFMQGVYLQNDVALGQRIRLGTGLRTTWYSLKRAAYFEPRVDIEYNVFGPLFFKTAWGVYYQFIDRLDHLDILDERSGFWVLADKAIFPTRSVHRIVGFRVEGRQRSAEVEFYSNRLGGLSELGQPTGSDSQLIDEEELFVGGKGWQTGLEMMVKQERGPVKGWISYAFSRSERLLPDRNQGVIYPTSQDHRHSASLVAYYARGPWQGSLSWQLTSGQPYTRIDEAFYERAVEEELEITNPEFFEGDLQEALEGNVIRLLYAESLNGTRHAASHRLDLSVARRFIVGDVFVDLGLTLYNLYNHRNIWRRDYNQYSVPLQAIDYQSPGFTPAVTLRVAYL